MALTQKTIRKNNQIELDSEVNKLLKEGWEISSDVKCVIYDIPGVSHVEIWYQSLRKFDRENS